MSQHFSLLLTVPSTLCILKTHLRHKHRHTHTVHLFKWFKEPTFKNLPKESFFCNICSFHHYSSEGKIKHLESKAQLIEIHVYLPVKRIWLQCSYQHKNKQISHLPFENPFLLRMERQRQATGKASSHHHRGPSTPTRCHLLDN